MKILMTVKNATYIWDEELEVDNDSDPVESAQEIINSFNDSLHEGESPRTLVSVKIIDRRRRSKHNWEKNSPVTIQIGGCIYSEYKCKNCGVTGRVYGLSHTIVRDKKYAAKIYDTCEGAMKQMKINELRRKE